MTRNEDATGALAADALARAVTGEGTACVDDDRRAAIDAAVRRALGRFADRAAITPEELAELMSWGRSTSYAACRSGAIPTIRVGRRVLVPVPALAAALLGATLKGTEGAETNGHGPGQ